jgi:hypothetical protein
VTAGTTVSKRVNVHVGQIARSDLRVTALASVYQKGSRSAVPLIRTADADRIDGVKDPVAGIARPAGAESSATSTSSESDIDWWLVAGLPAVLVLGAGAYGWQRRRSRVSAADVDTGDEPALAGAGTGERGER